METKTKLNELFVKCAKEVIPTINEAGIEYCMRYCDIDEEGPVCSDGELMNIFRKNLSVYINDNELYGLVWKVCYTFVCRINM